MVRSSTKDLISLDVFLSYSLGCCPATTSCRLSKDKTIGFSLKELETKDSRYGPTKTAEEEEWGVG